MLIHGLSPNLGGIERYLLNLVQSLQGADFHFDITHSDVGAPPALSGELAALGCSFYPVTPRARNTRRNRRELQGLMAQGFDVLHFNATSASYLAPVRAALRSSVPVLVHSHSAGSPPSTRSRAMHFIGRASPALAKTRRIAVSEPAGRWMFGPQRSWDVIENGFDPEPFQFRPETRDRLRLELGLSSRSAIGHVGAFLPAKNHKFLVSTFAEIVRQHPEATLVLVGAGPGEEQLRSHIAALGMEERVLLLGGRTDVSDLLSAMDLFVFPSIYEGSPLAVAEARAAGLPAVVSEAVPESMSGGSTNRMPLAAGPERWAATAVRLLTSSDRTPLPSGLPTLAEHALTMAEVYRGLSVVSDASSGSRRGLT
ncbi:glycosyltransferase [Tetrasphaera sp. F2B08]|uniref:glycosyltransferase n=1 Tax=Nostocoides sp. F2B08 TaxID=2653936 RepID=UPI001D0412D3